MKFKNAMLLLLLLTFALTLFGCPKPPPPVPEPEPVVEEEPPPEPEPVVEEEPPPPPLELVTVNFEFDKYDLMADARDIMAQNARELTDRTEAVIRIEGNCDERGTEEYNLALGEKRAKSAMDYLVNYGIDASQISIISYGESKPADLGHNEEAWTKNRRADFIAVSE